MDSVKRGIWKTVAVICVIMMATVSLFVYQTSKPRIMSVKELVNNGAITYQEPKIVEPFSLVADNGEEFTKKDFEGHWTLMFFGFTNCGGFCPATLAMLNSLVNQLEPEIKQQTQVVMVSVDPARDTPEALHQYMAQFNPEFVGVTGEFVSIKIFSNQFHVAFSKSTGHGEHYHIDHGEQIVLVNPKGEYHGFFKPPFTMGRLKTTYQSIVISNGG